jgi:hypothetical protein
MIQHILDNLTLYIGIYIGLCFLITILIRSKKEFKVSVNNEKIEFTPLQESVFSLIISPFVPVVVIMIILGATVVLILAFVIGMLAIILTAPLSLFGDSRTFVRTTTNEELEIFDEEKKS